MQKRSVKPGGDQLSILGYGAMRFPTKMGMIDEAKAIEQLHYAIDNGLNYIDTAYIYHGGQSETLIGKALKGGYREKVFIATKMPPWLVHTAKDMESIFENQLGRLQVETIDYYLLHALNKENWEKFLAVDALGFLEAKRAEGKIRHIGFSFHGDRALFKTIVDAYPWDFCQIQYNILDEYVQAGKEGLMYAASKNLAVFVMEPLRGGTLARKQPPEVQELYAHYPQKRTPVEWALKWLWNHPQVTLVLSGMTEDQHLHDNLAYAKEMLPNSMTLDEIALIDGVKDIYKRNQRIPCTACQYCMPCPFGVDIPRCFELYNAKYLLHQPVKTFYWMQLAGLNGKPSHASLCTGCGKCVKLCPQSIAIPKELGVVAKDLEGPFMKPVIKVGGSVLRAFSKKK